MDERGGNRLDGSPVPLLVLPLVPMVEYDNRLVLALVALEDVGAGG